MLQIQRIKRELHNEQEFIKYKKLSPLEEIRQVSKGANFSLLFGAAPYTFMTTTLEPLWTDTQASDFIALKNLHDLKDTMIQTYVDKQKPVPHDVLDYLVCSTYIRNVFFEKYHGLLSRIERNKVLVETQGFTRTYHGIIRRLPLFFLKGKDDSYKEMSGYINIAANSSIQSLEIAKVASCIIKINTWFRRMKLKSRVFNSVHDSVEFYLLKSELEVTVPKIYEIFEMMESWQKDVPLTIEFVVGNKYKKGIDAYDYVKNMKEGLE